MKTVNFEAWQLEHAQLGLSMSTKGKGNAGRDKFNGGRQDFSERVDLRGHLRAPKKSAAKKKKPKEPSAFQYLKNALYNTTYIVVGTTEHNTSTQRVNTNVYTIEQFLWGNQVQRDYPTVLYWYYSKELGGDDMIFSEKFFPKRSVC